MRLLYKSVSQPRGDENKVYSLHAPEVSCIAKGKVHKKYELGSKVSVDSLSGSNVVVGIANFVGNPHDSKTLAPTLDEVVQWISQRYARVLVDKGYRGHGKVGSSAVIIPGKKAHASAYAIRRHKTMRKRRSAIEAMIGHLKSEHRLGRKLSQGECDQTSVRLGRSYLFSIAKISLFFFFFYCFETIAKCLKTPFYLL